jgi:hypothetical protein
MTRNKIYTIVEGHGEAREQPEIGEQPSVTILVSRILYSLECWTLFPGRVRRLRSSGDFFKADKLENAIRANKEREDCAAVLILVDVDEACAMEKAYELTQRIGRMEQLPFSVVVVCPKPEYEAWFLASLESIHPAHFYNDDPEGKRDAKGWLGKNFGYKPTHHQSSYTHQFDLVLAYHRSRSFRRLHHAFEEVMAAVESGEVIITPVPQSKPLTSHRTQGDI